MSIRIRWRVTFRGNRFVCHLRVRALSIVRKQPISIPKRHLRSRLLKRTTDEQAKRTSLLMKIWRWLNGQAHRP